MTCYRGQIAAEYGEGNSASSNWKTVDQIKGWGKRYRVRIHGIHSEDKAVLPDSQLPWAEVMYPVTAGSGHGANYQTDSLQPGSTVRLEQDPDGKWFIIGCIGNNEQTKLSTTVPTYGFVPFSSNSISPVYNIAADSNIVFESAANAAFLSSWANHWSFIDGMKTADLASPIVCEKVPLGAIQIKLKNFINDITAAKSWVAKQKESFQRPISEQLKSPLAISSGISSALFNTLTPQEQVLDTKIVPSDAFILAINNQPLFNGQDETVKKSTIDEYISSKIQTISADIATPIKTLITQIQQYITNKINNTLKDVYYNLFPSELQKVKEKVETANDLIACLFRKIIRNLLKMCAKFLSAASDYLINTPLCAVENFIGGLIGKIVGLITSAIDAILAPLRAILGVFDLVQDILGLVSDLLSGISCDEEPSCAKIKEWSIWDGPESIASGSFNVTGLINKMKTFAANAQQSIDPDNFDFDLDFSDVFEDTCNVGAIACGPPIVQFSGGGGTGATGNAIISAAGSIIGVDITNSGQGYISSPLVKFYDSCGKGSGAVGQAIIGIPDGGQTVIGTATKGVTNVVITDPGSGYLPAPDGSSGGDGRTLTEPVTTTTLSPPIYPSKSNGQYPVILKLCEIYIREGGFGYSQGDEVVIEPSNGATATATISSGVITKIDVLTKGEGFTEMPNVFIKTATGYRAALIPRLCAERVGDNLSNVTTTNLEKIINVIDCPGR